ncbi:MAG: TonB-dependent receptor [Gemmatimonadetes bacterium]|nr:TonB-dependent receptor [Gemmatimonadota bacterium]
MTFDRSTTLAAWSAITVGAFLLGAGGAAAQAPTRPRAPADLSALDLEQLMQVEIVVAGSKRAQNTRDVPSFVSIVTAADIREHGYRTLADVLKTLPSFYVTSDRNYTYVGVRGFERSGDYNSRVLLLLNGLRTNDNVSNQAYIGEEFIVDADLIERIEVIRGPSAAIYGNNALFAVINVVTKQGADLSGGELTANAASYGTYGGRASYGKHFASDVDMLVSGSYSDSKGQRLYFPEFDSPATNNGFADAADRESFRKLFATVTKGNFSLLASDVSREKGIPTGSFGTLFNDARTHSTDGLRLASLAYNASFTQGSSVSAKVYTGRWINHGAFSFAADTPPTQVANDGSWWGVDIDATRTILARHFLTVGADFNDNTKQNQAQFDIEPRVTYTDVRNHSVNSGLFAQDEIKLLDNLTLYAGVRYDNYQAFGSATSPRVGLIYDMNDATTFKLLTGRAFRAPNEYELHFDNTVFEPNPDLRPESIETTELVVQRMIGPGLQVTATAFHNHLGSLITQDVDSIDGRLVFANAGEMSSDGGELGLTVNRGHGVTGQLSYSLQKSEDAMGTRLTSSPRQMGKLLLRAPFMGNAFIAGLDAQYVSALGTIGGNESSAYALANVSLLAPHLSDRLTLSATVYNLFGARYSNPGSDANIQDVIQQDGRSFRVKTMVRF